MPTSLDNMLADVYMAFSSHEPYMAGPNDIADLLKRRGVYKLDSVLEMDVHQYIEGGFYITFVLTDESKVTYDMNPFGVSLLE